MPRKASAQVNVARLPDQAAMVNESHALDAYEFRALRPRWESPPSVEAPGAATAQTKNRTRPSRSRSVMHHRIDFWP